MKIKMSKKHILILTCIAVFMILTFNIMGAQTKLNDQNQFELLNAEDFPQTSGYVLSPIFIDNSGGGDFTWEEAAQQIWCSGEGSITSPYIIENITIIGSGEWPDWWYHGIRIENSREHFIIRNCTLSRSIATDNPYEPFAGIRFENVTNGYIYNNTCSSNGNHGISLNNCSKIIISNNILENNGYGGVFLFEHCYNNEIYANNATDNGWGIYLSYSCKNNDILKNNLSANNGAGIFIENNCEFNKIINNSINDNWEFGIFLVEQCNNNTISTNTIGNINIHTYYLDYVQQYGIFLEECSENTIFNNTAYDNTDTGIALISNSNNNLLYFNYLFNNALHTAYDDCNNDWNNSMIGNFWDDYTGMDADDDGIGDSPYIISGSGGNQDHLPIWDDGYDMDTDSDGLFDLIEKTLGTNPLIPDTDEDGLSDGEEVLNWSSDPLNYMDPVNLPIFIDGDATGVGAHNWTWAINYKVCTGSGDYSDPYVIKDFIIDGGGLGNCIEIRDSDKYFVIQNCKLYNSGIGPDTDYFAAIKIRNSNNGKIIGNNCSENCHTAIRLEYCDNMTISQNDIKNVWQGIYLQYSDNNEIFDNELEEADIFLYHSHYNIIMNNSIKFENLGITLSASDYNIIKENKLSDLGYRGIYIMGDFNIIEENIIKDVDDIGISAKNCQNNTIFNNKIENNVHAGLHLESTCSNTVIYLNEFFQNGINAIDDGSNNQWYNTTSLIGNYWDDYQGRDMNDDDIGDTPYLISGLASSQDDYPIWADERNMPLLIDDDTTQNWDWASTQSWCTGSGTWDDPFIIKDAIIDGQGIYNSIEIRNSDVYFRIENCTFYNSSASSSNGGIFLEYTFNGKILNNTFDGNENGILMSFCDSNIISNNSFEGNQVGIYLNYSRINEISNNNINSNEYGIFIWGGSGNQIRNNSINLNKCGIKFMRYSGGNTVEENTISNSYVYGIMFDNGSGHNRIYRNIIQGGFGYGMYFGYQVTRCTVTGNLIASIGGYGIYFSPAGINNDNEYRFNRIYDTYDSNVYSDSFSYNIFDYNYYDQYYGIDANYDGIGDTSCFMPRNIEDRHPLMRYYPIPILTTPTDITYEVDTVGNTLSWTVTDTSVDNPNYTITIDRIPVLGHFSARWTSDSPIIVNIDGLAIGTYECEITVEDGFGGHATSSASITVISPIPGLSQPDDVTYEFGTTGHTISWSVIDLSVNNPIYTITLNGTPVLGHISRPWTSETPITIDIDNLVIATYEFKIIVDDGLENSIFDSVTVTVINIDPTLGKPNDVAYEVDTTGYSISWTVTDPSVNNPTYTISLDGTPVSGHISQTWASGTPITINVDGLAIDTYEYEIVVEDGFGSSTSDIVSVVVFNVNPIVSEPKDVYYSLGEVGNIISWTMSDSSVNNPTYTITQDGNPIQGHILQPWVSGVAIGLSVDGLFDGLYEYKIIIEDGYGGTGSDIVEVKVFKYRILPIIIDDTGGGDYTWDQAVAEDWCSGDGTISDPHIIENIIIDASSFGILIRDSNVYFIVRNCIFYDCEAGEGNAGLVLENVINGLIINNYFMDNNENGIYMNLCESNDINNNIFEGNEVGIYLNHSRDNEISNNSVSDNNYGIVLWGSNWNKIHNNSLNLNWCGIMLTRLSAANFVEDNIITNSDDFGIRFEDIAGNNFIYRNIIHGVYGGYGMFFGYQVTRCIVSDNTITYVGGYGIYLSEYSIDNEFRYNRIYDTTDYNAFSFRYNIFDYNYYDRYNGIDANYDGIGDTPFYIPYDRQDRHPLMRYYPIPAITAPEDITYEVDTVGNIISWTVSDATVNNPNYTVYIDGILLPGHISQPWTSEVPIVVNIDGLAIGTYECKIMVDDGLGGHATDSISVRVISPIPGLSQPDDVTYEFGTIGHIISWDIIDLSVNNPTYIITLDGTPVPGHISQPWASGTSIIINIDSLAIGAYEFEITVEDGLGNSASDTVSVIVVNLNPVLSNPSDITYEVDTTGHSISWMITDPSVNNPNYTIYLNGIPEVGHTSLPWTSGTPIIVNIDGLTIGVYEYTIVIEDGFGSSNFDTVYITVFNLNPILSEPEDVYYSLGELGNFIGWTIVDLSVYNPTYTIYQDGYLVPGHISQPWISGVPIELILDGLVDGLYNYEIIIEDGYGGTGSDIAVVKVFKYRISPTIIDNTGGGDYTWEEAVAEEWCSGEGTINEPYIIENVMVDASSYGIFIRNSNAYFIVRNCMFYDCEENSMELDSENGDGNAGLVLDNVINGLVINNYFTDNNENGIYMNLCESIEINDNLFEGNQYGIYLRSSDYNEISNNNISNNNCGINFYISNRNEIYSNIVNSNGAGIVLLYVCGANFIEENIISDNDQFGIHFVYGAGYNFIIDNTFITLGYGIGVYIEDGTNGNLFTGNEFTNSILGSGYGIYIPPWGGCFNNDFRYNLFHGDLYIGRHQIFDFNYYFLYEYWNLGIDANHDGIGDTPFDALGVFDYHPLMRYFPVPALTTPNDITYEVNTVGNTLNWTVIDTSVDNPNYTITINGIPVSRHISQAWTSNSPIIINIDGLAIGTYEYEIKVEDGFGGHTENIVFVTVISDDFDGDRLKNSDESLYGTDPNNPDSDGDGFTDGYEVWHSFDPLNPDDPTSHGDYDNDGLSDEQELEHGTDPFASDTDGDGINDNDEVVLYGTDPLANVDTYTPEGEDIEIFDENTNITLDFSNVLEPGATTITVNSSSTIGEPNGFMFSGLPGVLSITTTAPFVGIVEIAIPYNESLVSDEDGLQLLHYNSDTGRWEDITTRRDTINNIIYGETEGFSEFAIMERIIDSEIVLNIDPGYIDENGNIFVTSATAFTFSEEGSEYVFMQTFYRINNGGWIEYIEPFTIDDSDGYYVIDYYSIDIDENVGIQQKSEVMLVNLEINSYLGDGDQKQISYFDLVIKDRKSNGYEIVATNPGQIFYYIEITNSWPININDLCLGLNIPEGFILKGSNPIHVYLNGEDITELCTIDGSNIIIADIAPESSIKVVVHLDYGLKNTFYNTLEEIPMNSYIFTTNNTAQGEGLIQSSPVHSNLIAHQKKLTAIAGYVMDINGNLLQNVVVELYDSTGQVLKGSTVTDENGFFFFIDIEEGEYQVHILYEEHTDFEIVTAFRDEMTLVLFVIPDEDL